MDEWMEKKHGDKCTLRWVYLSMPSNLPPLHMNEPCWWWYSTDHFSECGCLFRVIGSQHAILDGHLCQLKLNLSVLLLLIDIFHVFCSFQRFDFRWFIRLWAAFSQTMTFYCSKILFTIFHSECVFFGIANGATKMFIKMNSTNHASLKYKL